MFRFRLTYGLSVVYFSLSIVIAVIPSISLAVDRGWCDQQYNSIEKSEQYREKWKVPKPKK